MCKTTFTPQVEPSNRSAFLDALGVAGQTASDLLDALEHYSDVAEPTQDQVTHVVGWSNSLKALRDLIRLELSKTTRAGALL